MGTILASGTGVGGRSRFGQSIRIGAGAALGGCLLVALTELAIALAVGGVSLSVGTVLRFVALDVTLVALAALVLMPIFALVFAVVRLRITDDTVAAETAPRKVIPWIWTLVVAAAVYVLASYGLTRWFTERFRAPELVALALAALQLAVIAVLVPTTIFLASRVRRVAHALDRRSLWNPLGSWRDAGVIALVGAGGALLWGVNALPQLKNVLPWRVILAGCIFVLGGYVALRYELRRGILLPRTRKARIVVFSAGIAVYLGLAPLTLVVLGRDPDAKYLATTASPPLDLVVQAVRRLNDLDGDGFGSLLGETDCAPFDRRIHPTARDLPDNGIDENCTGRDFSTRNMAAIKPGERLPVPPEYRRGWNILLITIDTVRYDHTGFGGYKRPTTPRLDDLSARSVSFAFANAPSAGTMASVPAIMTSRFFHSGIELGPERKPQPPKITLANTTLPEVMKRGGYHTGAILSHEYFNDWGMEQGVDSFDNALGAKPDAYRITSQEVTDKAQAWISEQTDTKWFLWAHYIDPHGRYVAHPGETQFGSTEEDLYDGEIAFADKHIGRLLDFLARSPAFGRTVVMVTSDHGDGFKEHGFVNHGVALYRELLHVPLIVYVPDIEPHIVSGPVSPLDILPTVADLAGIDISDLPCEGESLVPQLFYGRDAKSRVVFAETNYTEPQRAAISDDYKLIYNLKTNLYQLYDLKKDPWEKKNLWGKDRKGGDQMKALLDDWLDRVFFKRDSTSQAQRVRERYLLAAMPRPGHVLAATIGDAVEVLGWDANHVKAGDGLDVTIYFRAARVTDKVYKFEVEARGEAKTVTAKRMTTKQEKAPAEGMLPTSRWQKGDVIKETFSLRVPKDWQITGVELGLRLIDEKRQPAPVVGPAADPDGRRVILGTLASLQ